MEDFLLKILTQVGGVLWGWPLLIILVGSGIGFTIYLRGVQFMLFGHAFKILFGLHKDESDEADKKQGDISHFQALMTALSATVGAGNIAGVATAIAAGGPGAVLWMWLTGLLGMATKYAESLLGVHYRTKNDDGTMAGGPMYYITQGTGQGWLGWLYALFLVFAALIVAGMVQSNAIADVVETTFAVPTWVTGVVLTILCGLVILGGIKRIGAVASAVVPTMVAIYLATGLLILILNFDKVPAMFEMIFTHAFSGTAAVGGFLGAAVKEVMRWGLARGVFSNESGLGSSAIAAATAKTKHPVEQALVSMTQTFIDTILVCTTTAVVILLSGLWTVGADTLNGPSLTAAAITSGLGGIQLFGLDIGGLLISVGLAFFVFTSIVGWGGVYGAQASIYLFGTQTAGTVFKWLLLASIMLGTLVKLDLVWAAADIAVALMIFPNIIGLVWLAPKIRALTNDYARHLRGKQRKYKIKPFINE